MFTVLQAMYVQQPQQKLVTNKWNKTPLLKEEESKEKNSIIQLFQNLYVQFKL